MSSLKSHQANLTDLVTLLLNTPLVDPESTKRPNAIELKTFSETRGVSIEYPPDSPNSPRSYATDAFGYSSRHHSRQSSTDTIAPLMLDAEAKVDRPQS